MKKTLSALDKSLVILEAITEQPQPIGLPDIAAKTGLPRQTTHRVLQQLQDARLIVKDTKRDRFFVGPRLSRLALGALLSSNQGTSVRTVLQELVDDIQETCNIGVLDGLDFIYLERIECHWSLRVHLQAGSHVPAYCTSGGKALLANLPAELRTNLLRSAKMKSYTPHTIVKRGQLEAECEKIRAQGFAANNQEFNLGIVGVGVPIVDKDMRPLAALALHGPIARLSLKQAKANIPKLQQAANKIAGIWKLQNNNKDLSFIGTRKAG